MGFFRKLIDSEYKELKRFEKIANQIEALSDEMEALSDEELKAKTTEFKEQLENGATLDDIVVPAFAVVREAACRVIGEKPYFVQLLGGLAIHYGNIAEMKTGEGKTLTETMPTYLNALTGKGVHIITVNEFLAKRDSEWMGNIFRFLGLTVGLNMREMSPSQKREAYNCDVLYSTNNEVGFDYLRDNMVVRAKDRVQRPLNFCIVDEVDSILIDEARTPLIISGGAKAGYNLYEQANTFVKRLHEDVDFEIDEKAKHASLTPEGIQKAEEYFKIENLYDVAHVELLHRINNALRANYIMKNQVDYVVQEGQVIIVDPFTGRLMHGRQWSEGLHQAIEAKEGVEIKKETRTLATITFQNYFRMYAKLAGMTGTAKTEEEEFRDIYNMLVVEIPTNVPVVRVDDPDLIFFSEKAKYEAISEEIKRRHEIGQPILVGTISIETSELLSSILKRKGIPHNVLNAKQHAREAEIVSHAGEKGAVTIATNMAGRGTDIMLGGNAEYLAKAKLTQEGISNEVLEKITAYNVELTDEEKELKAKYNKLFKEYEIETADLILLSMGSLFTSVIPNLLSKSIKKAIDESNAKIVYCCNLFTQPGETDDFKVSHHVKTLNKYLGKRKVNYVIANSGKIDNELAKKYATEEQKDPIVIDKLKTEKLGVELIIDDLVYIKMHSEEHKNVFRHNYVKLGFLINTIALDYAYMLKNKNN